MKVLPFLLVLLITTLAFGGNLPDTTKTPGDTNRAVMLMELCHPEYLRGANIPPTVRANVLKNYGLTEANMNSYIMTFSIPVCLGGSATIKNIWPLKIKGEWNYFQKKIIDKKLNHMVCNAEISLQEAREIIKSDWILAYKIFILQDTSIHYYPYSFQYSKNYKY